MIPERGSISAEYSPKKDILLHTGSEAENWSEEAIWFFGQAFNLTKHARTTPEYLQHLLSFYHHLQTLHQPQIEEELFFSAKDIAQALGVETSTVQKRFQDLLALYRKLAEDLPDPNLFLPTRRNEIPLEKQQDPYTRNFYGVRATRLYLLDTILTTNVAEEAETLACQYWPMVKSAMSLWTRLPTIEQFAGSSKYQEYEVKQALYELYKPTPWTKEVAKKTLFSGMSHVLTPGQQQAIVQHLSARPRGEWQHRSNSTDKDDAVSGDTILLLEAQKPRTDVSAIIQAIHAQRKYQEHPPISAIEAALERRGILLDDETRKLIYLLAYDHEIVECMRGYKKQRSKENFLESLPKEEFVDNIKALGVPILPGDEPIIWEITSLLFYRLRETR